MIRAIITDFDGTLVDTFEANLRAYQKALSIVGVKLTAERYRQCFGYRFDRLMTALAIFDDKTTSTVKKAKAKYYPQYFKFLRPNTSLIQLIESFHQMGGKTVIASTASKENLMNILDYLGIAYMFDHIYTGVDVIQGKPSPEIYIKAMASLDVKPEETLIFEDSEVGIEAAKASGAHLMIVSPKQFSK